MKIFDIVYNVFNSHYTRQVLVFNKQVYNNGINMFCEKHAAWEKNFCPLSLVILVEGFIMPDKS